MDKEYVLTASQARELANEKFSSEVIFNSIKDAAGKGRFETEIKTPTLTDKVKVQLNDLGYKVKEHSKFDTTLIQW